MRKGWALSQRCQIGLFLLHSVGEPICERMVPASSDTKEHNPLIVAGPGKELQYKSKKGVSH